MSARDRLARLQRLDAAAYDAVASSGSPVLDDAFRRLSNSANYSGVWIGIAAAFALVDGRAGRRAAADGLASIAVTATVVNAVLKPLSGRRRPERRLPQPRQVRMPPTRSFPSGHAAAAAAFATGVSRTSPRLGLPVGTLAAAVAYSRVHTGVHYPGDVLAGALIGSLLSRATTHLLRRHPKAATSGGQDD